MEGPRGAEQRPDIFSKQCRNRLSVGVYVLNGKLPDLHQRNTPMATNTARNISNAKKLIDEVINTGNVELCGRYLAANRVDHQDYGLLPGSANGHAGFRRVL